MSNTPNTAALVAGLRQEEKREAPEFGSQHLYPDNDKFGFGEQTGMDLSRPSFFQRPVMRSLDPEPMGGGWDDGPLMRSMGGLSIAKPGFSGEQSFWPQQEQHPTAFPSVSKQGLVGAGGENHLAPHQKAKGLVEPDLVAPVPYYKLQDAPIYVEQFTSFLSRVSAGEILHRAQSLFLELRVDTECSQRKHSIKGLVYVQGAAVLFKLKVFKHCSGIRLVEFQRRSGCVVAFNGFYQDVVARLHDLVACELAVWQEGEEIPIRREVEGPDCIQGVPMSLDGLGAVELDQSCIQSLVGMAGSTHMDVQCEGLRALAGVSSSDFNQQALTAEETANTIIQCLRDGLVQEGEIGQWASLLLSHVTSGQFNLRSQSLELLESMAKILAAPSCLSNRATKRQVASAVAALAQTHSADLLASAHYSTLLEALSKASSCHDDAQLQATAEQTLRCVRAF
mmetsp:Transcript_9697/g.10973  ORF Transcript_9697/g.10973 Transcript_9697/m.10973 type:complete len:452 (-) Transcript_9697:231-1586(-)|eukprot:CAMPEP_0205828546 /NCGR_PEP_ID=MMETSP0206-20130828/35501_1 /ASSEMBLY_ACC=CAM_ASM_000279 /TAXON_ID=36767 /ORGANISM="Euplotes focardii, Strain TN1" /LENGTH=451 /DNA_ID=CAMNT_0053130499 /DNA_START=36 /DNA_END=1391 /DNA_ORIENTATION=+